MKFSEKKIQVLLALYERKFDGKFYEISELLGDYGIGLSYEESYQIGKDLEGDGFVKLAASYDSVSAYINGMMFLMDLKT
ncbi:hypothetical protein SAMN04488028_101354 [Reichenbachiella agariperforans]|uniref:Uncharacterized protein n=1 Tax=Reichenbachiella agariperforans TaxID=156994 RepID=A0A1M6JX29_REIAG|nr:hypothetical protein [Reichenbachiella agariperforans]SHJ51236.1 hypothetical protein SAMN04488028_101354 [Reichenbachiella agariperforans]